MFRVYEGRSDLVNSYGFSYNLALYVDIPWHLHYQVLIYTSGRLNHASAGPVYVAGEKEKENPRTRVDTRQQPHDSNTRQERNDLPTHNPVQQQ